MGDQNNFAIAIEIVGIFVMLNDFINLLDQGLRGFFIALQPVVTMCPYRIVIIIQPQYFVLTQSLWGQIPSFYRLRCGLGIVRFLLRARSSLLTAIEIGQ
ncbi:hypothetical protein VI26_00330 [Chromobacterium sp. LK1]|nr:hypothetical protein VI26_00330 [Chromobacterium sp. LK1]